MSLGAVLLYGLLLYGIAGLCTAAAFVVFGATKVLAHPAHISLGARIFLLPGTAALWPYVLYRWLASGHRR
jgi:hypothetical protein